MNATANNARQDTSYRTTNVENAIHRILRMPRICFALAAVLVATVMTVSPVAASSSAPWKNTALHVVGGPVVAGNMLLVLNVTSQRELEISGVNPSNGVVAWSHPYSPSQITLGAAFTPIAIGSIALVLAPAAALNNPVVTVEGVNVDSGKVLWKIQQPADVSDAPVVCGDARYFCFPVFGSATTTELITVDPVTGGVVAVLPGPYRNVGVAVTGATNASNLWQTDAKTETLLQTSPGGKRLWARTVGSLFGGSQFATDYGYDFLETNDLDVGTVGVRPVGKTESLSEFKTIGIVPSSGVVKWSAPGSIFCTGSLQFLSPFVMCEFTGKATLGPTSLNLSGVTLTLSGISSSTGKTTWSKPVANVKNLALGKSVAFSDTSHVVVETPAKKWVLLDVKNGKESSIPNHETFWCEQTSLYKVVAVQGEADSGMRAGEPDFVGCSKTGTPVNTLPSTTPNSVGVVVGHEFIWSTTKGLRSFVI